MALVSLFVFATIRASWAATFDEAKALGEKSAGYVKANGKERGIAEIGNTKGQFHKGDLYVTVHGFDGTIIAFPPNPKLVGQNHIALKDPQGRFFNKEMVEIAKNPGSGWYTYVWTNNATKKIQPKKSWIQRVEGTEMYTLCGIWQ